jgi:hypothetical protein
MRMKNNKEIKQLHNYYYHVVPAKAGTQNSMYLLDSRLRGNDGIHADKPFSCAPGFRSPLFHRNRLRGNDKPRVLQLSLMSCY